MRVVWPSGSFSHRGGYCDLILEVLSRRVTGECGGLSCTIAMPFSFPTAPKKHVDGTVAVLIFKVRMAGSGV